MYRRIVSYVRQSLTVALCLDDDEVATLCPSFPTLTTCPSVRLEEWSAGSMRLAASRSLSAHRFDRPPATAVTETATCHNNTVPRPSLGAGREKRVVAVKAAQQINAHGGGMEGARGLCSRLSGKGGVFLWSGATHANLVGGLAFGRFQSTVLAFRDPTVANVSPGADSGFSDRVGAHVAERIKKDANAAAEESEQLFDAWMAMAKPSCCIEVYQVVEACAGGGSVGGGFMDEESSSGDQGQPSWSAVKARCFRAMAEEGRGPRPASLGQVLLLFKHLCRLGCHRQVEIHRARPCVFRLARFVTGNRMCYYTFGCP